jgi:hypothetical protein
MFPLWFTLLGGIVFLTLPSRSSGNYARLYIATFLAVYGYIFLLLTTPAGLSSHLKLILTALAIPVITLIGCSISAFRTFTEFNSPKEGEKKPTKPKNEPYTKYRPIPDSLIKGGIEGVKTVKLWDTEGPLPSKFKDIQNLQIEFTDRLEFKHIKSTFENIENLTFIGQGIEGFDESTFKNIKNLTLKRTSNLVWFPEKWDITNLTVTGETVLSHFLPTNLKIKGVLSIKNNQEITSLPDGLTAQEVVLYRSKVSKVGENTTLQTFSTQTKIKSIGKNFKVDHLTIDNSLEKLPKNLQVKDLDIHTTKPLQLPDNLVLQNLSIAGTGIRELPENLKVLGNLILTNSQVTKFTKNLYVGKNLYKKLYATTTIPTNVTVKGFVKSGKPE